MSESLNSTLPTAAKAALVERLRESVPNTSPLAQIAGCEVDLVDMRAASTVMQYQILTTGKRWFAADTQADFYEVAVLSEKLADLLTFSRHILTSQPRISSTPG